jgi:hypothetical protein
MDNFNSEDELKNRLAKSDPAKAKPELILKDSLLLNASETKTLRSSLSERFRQAQARTRQLILSGSLVASAAAVALVLVVTSPPSGPIIQLASNSNSGMQSAEMSSDASQDSLKMMMPYVSYNYVAGPGLSNDTGNGKVYKIVRTGNPEEILTGVAELFDVRGEIRKVPEFSKDNPSYFISESKDAYGYDAVNPMVSIWWNGTGSWNYSNPAANPPYVEPACESASDTGECLAWAEIKPTPELLPSRAEAVAKAIEVFNATGLDVTEADLRVYQDDWGMSIMSSLKVDDIETNIEWYIGWSSTGQISYAGGQSVEAQEMGSFNTISAVSAVDRISDWRWSGSPPSSFYEKYQPVIGIYDTSPSVRGVEPSPEEAGSSAEGSSGEAATSDETVEPSDGSGILVDPMAPEETAPPVPEVVELEVLEAVATRLTIWDANGDVWLVPGYVLVNSQGWFNAVISLIEGIIALPEDTGYEIMPMNDSVKIDQ